MSTGGSDWGKVGGGVGAVDGHGGATSAQQRTRWKCGRHASPLGQGLEFFDMPQQFRFRGPADQVEADNFVGSLGGLSARPERDQQAGDDGAIRLNLDAAW